MRSLDEAAANRVNAPNLEGATLQFCNDSDRRTYRLDALKRATEAGDEKAVLAAAWGCIAELPLFAHSNVLLRWDARDGLETWANMRSVALGVMEIVSGVDKKEVLEHEIHVRFFENGKKHEVSVRKIDVLTSETTIRAIEDHVRVAASKYKRFAPWAYTLAGAVRPGIETCERLVTELKPEPAVEVRP